MPPFGPGFSPVSALKNLFPPAGLTVSDIDVFEINEAFASQVSPEKFLRH